MSRFEKRLLLGLALLVIAIVYFEASAPEPIDWSPSYSRQHRKPYGAQLVYDRLRDLFPAVNTVRDPLDQMAADRIANTDIGSAPVNHLFINSYFAVDDNTAEQLLALAGFGDRLFIAAEGMHGLLVDTLHIEMGRMFKGPKEISDIRFIGEQRLAPGVFHFSKHFPGTYFSSYDTSRTRVLAVDGASHPVLLEMAWGDGRIVLCSAPRAFTNYNLLKNDNARFMAAALSLLPAQPVLWNEFYKSGLSENTSIVRFLLDQPALRWAWFLALSLIALYMLVYTRRQQRAIPVMLPLRNSTRDLAHTIGRLYWHKGDHGNIARKMIAHFKDEVRARTYLRTFAYDEVTVAHLATKTGREQAEIAHRLGAFQRREVAGNLTEKDLLDLSTELHEFRQLIH